MNKNREKTVKFVDFLVVEFVPKSVSFCVKRRPEKSQRTPNKAQHFHTQQGIEEGGLAAADFGGTMTALF